MRNQTQYFLSSAYLNPEFDPINESTIGLVDAANAAIGMGTGRQWTTSSLTNTCFAIQVISSSTFDNLNDDGFSVVPGLVSTLSFTSEIFLYGNFLTASVSGGLIVGYYK